MPQPDYFIRQNDTGEAITATLEDSAGDAVNLTGASVVFTMRPIGGGEAKVDAAASITVAADGEVEYTWQGDDTDTDGWYVACWTVTFSGGEVQSFPNGGWTLIQVTPVNETSATDFLTVQQLKDTMEIDGNYVDQDIVSALKATSRVVEKALNRRFYPTPDTTRYYTGRPSESDLIIGDWSLITAVSLDEVGDRTYTRSLTVSTDYDLEPFNAPADDEPYETLRLRRGQRFPHCTRNVEVQGTYGWAAPPDEVVQYTKILAAQVLLRPRQAPFGILMAGVEIGTSARLARFDPDFQRLLGHLSRIRPFA